LARRCNHPTPSGPCANGVASASRCAAGHPSSPATVSGANVAAAGHDADPFADEPAPRAAKTGGIVPGRLDDDAIHTYTHGQCHALALAVHEETGWPIEWAGRPVCVFDEDCPPEDWPDGTCPCQVDHVVVRRPDGLLLDAHGPRTDLDVLSDTLDPGVAVLRPADPDRVRELHTAFDWQTPDMGTARTFVRQLLADDHDEAFA
jgi:hypothetical protein